MRPRDESCFRVPVRATGPVTHYDRSTTGRVGPAAVVRRTKDANGAWGPIVSAVDAEEAVAKVRELYPDAVFEGAPELMHGPSNHRGEGSNVTVAALARVGFA